ncbi:unnamed protein product [Mytilus edulis]|uniref:WSC domain-containing protein n=1 Tax=Mytilus edulis TaxID=6550 RepID=A0A8S3U6A4_MYTED|nr:unnamed protein product [Mytilus edulis]
MNTLCYKLDRSWIYTTWNVIPSNILCENQCKENSANYQYYGTSYDNCYCRKTELLDDHKEEHHRCTHQCSVDSVGICGGFHGEDRLLTVSEIDYGYLPVNMRGQLSLAASPYKITDDRSVGIVGKQCYKFDESWTYNSWNNQSTNIVCEDLCKEADVNNQYYGTMYDECYCRQTEPPNDTIEEIELCNEQCSNNTFEICGGYHVDYSLMTVSEIDRTSETVIETNTQRSSVTYVSTRDSAMTEFMNMITSDTSLAITTNSTPFTSRELSSTTSQTANNDIPPVMNETSTQAITDRTSVTVIETNTPRSKTYVSTRDSAMTEFINMITSDTS